MPEPIVAPTPSHPPLDILPGYGFAKVPRPKWERADLQDLRDRILIFEAPRRGCLYVLSADVGDGVGLDNSVGDVTRVGTVTEPDEQVAQFVSDQIDPTDFAKVLDALGRFYTGSDNLPALAAIEVNGPGIATLSEMNRHLGYDNFFVWQHEDARDPRSRYSARLGFWTSRQSRTIILNRYVKKVKTKDENTGARDYVINSPFTIEELRDFQTSGGVWQAEADPSDADAHDDCIPPYALVRTREGMKAICEIVIGDLVLTGAGRFMPVLRVGRRRTQELMRVSAWGRPCLELTGNHRILAAKRERPNGTQPPLRHGQLKFVSADEGLDASWGTVSVAPRAEVSIREVRIPPPPGFREVTGRLLAFDKRGRRLGRCRPIPSQLPVDPDFLRLLGYFAAEGSCGRHSVQWASHARERSIRVWLLGYLRSLGLAPFQRRVSAAGWIVGVSSVPLREFFRQFSSSTDKRFPWWVSQLPPAFQAEILVGHLVGDASFMDGTVKLATISPHFAYQLQEMSLRNGWRVSVCKRMGQNGHNRQWHLTWAGPEAHKIRALFPAAWLRAKRASGKPPRVDQSKLRLDGLNLIGGVRSVLSVPYEGWVYNLEVQEDHSYVVEGTVVSNCIIAGAIGLYVCHTTQMEEGETLADRRRRLSEQRAREKSLEDKLGVRRDYRNTDYSAEEVRELYGSDEAEED